jgi:4-hydroxy-tetrahydrodipicolinate synthase
MTGFAFPERLAEIVELAGQGRWDDVEQAYEALLPAIVFEGQPGQVVLRKAILFERRILPTPTARAPGKISASAWVRVRQLVQRFA